MGTLCQSGGFDIWEHWVTVSKSDCCISASSWEELSLVWVFGMLLIDILLALVNKPGWRACCTSFFLFPVALTNTEAWSPTSVRSSVANFSLSGPGTGERRGSAGWHDITHSIFFDISFKKGVGINFFIVLSQGTITTFSESHLLHTSRLVVAVDKLLNRRLWFGVVAL